MRYLKYLIIFLLALGWFAFFQPWGSFPDPDAFYHAKMASLMLERGIIRDFSWLDLTSFNQPFANHHFLFQVALLPFVKAFGMLPGNQVAAVVFAAGFSTLFYFLLRSLKIKYPEFWALLLVSLPPLIMRLSLAKASPLAIAFTCLGFVALLKRKPLWGALAGVLLALTHGGWILLLLLQGAALVGMYMFDRVVQAKSHRDIWKDERALNTRSQIVTFAFTALGLTFGFLIHPYANTLLPFLWVQIVKIGVATPVDRVIMGQEWYPYKIGNLLSDLAPAWVALAACVGGLSLYRFKQLEIERARQAMALLIPTGALFIMTLKSMRFVEYLVPLLVLLLATLAQLIDWKLVWAEVRRLGQPLVFILVFLISGLMLREVSRAWSALHNSPMPFDEYAGAMRAVAEIAKPGDRIFNSDWSIFPQLFALDDRFKYISGLDPTFLLEADPELSDEYTQFTLGQATSSAYLLIHDKFGSRVVLIERRRNEQIIEALTADSRFKIIYEDSEALVFEVN